MLTLTERLQSLDWYGYETMPPSKRAEARAYYGAMKFNAHGQRLNDDGIRMYPDNPCRCGGIGRCED